MTTTGPGTSAPEPIAVHICTRLGRQANPPSARLALSGWLRRRSG